MKRFDEAVVHVGLHKTGTTTIQEVLHKHRESLETDFGIKYPGFSANHSVALYSLFSDNPLDYRQLNPAENLTGKALAARNTELRRLIEQELVESSASRLLLSGEDIGVLSVAGLEKMREWLLEFTYNIKIIAYVRDPAGWATSAAQHLVQDGRTLEEIAQQPPLQQVRGKIGNIVRVFGKDKLMVLSFDAVRQKAGGLLASFIDTLGISPEWRKSAQSARENRSPSQGAIELISALNRVRPLRVGGRTGPMRINGDIEQIIRLPGPKFELDADVLRQIDVESREDIAWLAREFDIALPYSPPAEKSANAQSAGNRQLFVDAEQIALLVSNSFLVGQIESLWLQGRHAIHRQDYASAANIFREIVRIKPDHIDAYRQLSNVCQNAGLYEDAEAAARMAQELRPGNDE